jgi:hypothetical protein
MAPGIKYEIRPQSLKRLDFVSLWESKIELPKHYNFYTGYASIVTHGSLYEGQLIGNRTSGAGVMYQQAGDRSPSFRYIGKFNFSAFHDNNCEYVLANGDVFTGSCKRQRNGSYYCKGQWVYADGTRYVGQVIENYRQGHGVMYYLDGSSYKGPWKHNQKHGRGVLTLPNGTKVAQSFIGGLDLNELANFQN